ncbi:hypothetical protein AAIP36_002519 [Flavobacterium psychrophilum]|nr:hypothetical protein [Flavobacterium psychrophilum]
MQKNFLDYLTIKSTISELIKVGENEIADNLLDILNHNELPKPEKHNLKKDIKTSFFNINLSSEFIDKIIDLFAELEVGSLTEDGESTNSTSYYVNILDKWSKIKND